LGLNERPRTIALETAQAAVIRDGARVYDDGLLSLQNNRPSPDPQWIWCSGRYITLAQELLKLGGSAGNGSAEEPKFGITR